MTDHTIKDVATASLVTPVSDQVQAMANYITAQSVDGGAVCSVLLYGSGLWQKSGADDCIYDFQVLVKSYHAYDGNWFLAALGAVLPPNVYYAEIEHNGQTLRFKYNVMRESQFVHAAKGRSFTPAIWARYAQPSRLVYYKDQTHKDKMVAAISACLHSFFDRTARLKDAGTLVKDSRSFWTAGLSATYQDEMRSEAKNRPQLIYEAAPDYYDAVFDVMKPCALPYASSRKILRPLRKAAALCRVIKGALTFENGVDYALWKVERHSGVKEIATPFQKKYPLIAGWPLLWRLYRKGAFR